MFNKILVAVDGSDASLHALDIAAKIALDNDAELTILTVVPYPPPMLTDDALPSYLPEYQDALKDSHKKMLQKTNKELKTKHPTLKTVPIVMEGRPAKTITDAARARETDLIVVGSRGTSGIIDWMLGTVSQQIANSCTAPVLIVKDQKYCQK